MYTKTCHVSHEKPLGTLHRKKLFLKNFEISAFLKKFISNDLQVSLPFKATFTDAFVKKISALYVLPLKSYGNFCNFWNYWFLIPTSNPLCLWKFWMWIPIGIYSLIKVKIILNLNADIFFVNKLSLMSSCRQK